MTFRKVIGMTHTPAQIIASERKTIADTLREAGPLAPTLCRGWDTRHMVAHLLLRETKPLVAAGVMGGPLSNRTLRITAKLAHKLTGQRRYEKAIEDFEKLPGYLGMRTRNPNTDTTINLIEYFVHTEDIRRAVGDDWEPRVLDYDVEARIWSDLLGRAGLMARKKYPAGLILESPGFEPAAKTIFHPQPGAEATILRGAPGELALYLFGREPQARVERIDPS